MMRYNLCLYVLSRSFTHVFGPVRIFSDFICMFFKLSYLNFEKYLIYIDKSIFSVKKDTIFNFKKKIVSKFTNFLIYTSGNAYTFEGMFHSSTGKPREVVIGVSAERTRNDHSGRDSLFVKPI